MANLIDSPLIGLHVHVQIRRLKELTTQASDCLHKAAKNPMQQLGQKMAASGYEEKVPENFKHANVEKIDGRKKKVSITEEAIANFERLSYVGYYIHRAHFPHLGVAQHCRKFMRQRESVVVHPSRRC
jgi:hypothetical protein